jgi:hypothetical protein
MSSVVIPGENSPYGAITFRIFILSITTFSMMTLSIKGLYVTLRVKDTEHNQQ